MAFDELNEPAQQFLKRLFEQTGGQTSRQISMYDIGAALGWERETALQEAQDLMAAGLVEIRTLSGGIGISAEGIETVRSALAPAAPDPSLPRLGSGRIMETTICRAVERVCDGIKARPAVSILISTAWPNWWLISRPLPTSWVPPGPRPPSSAKACDPLKAC